MSTAQELVTESLRLLGQLDIYEDAPSPILMNVGLKTLEMMLASWKTKGLNLAEVTVTGTVEAGSTEINDIASTAELAPGLNVTGTGVSSRIDTVDSTTKITLKQAATISGSSVSLVCTALPFEDKYERGIAALLALDLAPKVQEAEISDMVRVMATDGWTALTANYMLTPEASFDRALIYTSVRRSGIVSYNG